MNFKGLSRSTIILIIVLALIIIPIFSIAGSFISTYNGLIDMEEDVKLAKANVQTMMQRRLELIPDLVETTKAAAAHEEKIYEDIANARAALTGSLESGNLQELDEANTELTTSIKNLIKVINENYPEISASDQYTSLMDQLEGSVNRISVARESYNEVVSKYNKKVRRFPGSIIANMFGFEEIEEFKADEEANNTNMVDFS